MMHFGNGDKPNILTLCLGGDGFFACGLAELSSCLAATSDLAICELFLLILWDDEDTDNLAGASFLDCRALSM